MQFTTALVALFAAMGVTATPVGPRVDTARVQPSVDAALVQPSVDGEVGAMQIKRG